STACKPLPSSAAPSRCSARPMGRAARRPPLPAPPETSLAGSPILTPGKSPGRESAMDARTRGPALPDRERPATPWARIARRVLAAVLVIAAGVLAFPQTRLTGHYPYRQGQTAREPVVAPFDFQVLKDEVALEREREAATGAV